MSDRHQQMTDAAKSVRAQFDELDNSAFEAQVRYRFRQQVKRRRAAVVVAVSAVAIAAAVLFRPGVEKPKAELQVATVTPAGPPEVTIGSDADVVMAPSAPVRVVRQEAGLLWLEVMHDSAKFVVAPQHGRMVRVSAADVQVEVVGTAFIVARAADQVTVTVTEGLVRVRSGRRETMLAAGQHDQFAPVIEAAVEPVEAAPVEEVPVAKHVVHKTPKVAVRTASWRGLAEKGDFGGAWTALQEEGAPEDEPGDLLRAADVARLSGHPGQSLAPLQRVLSRFSADPRASLAAFTLGRVLLDDLGNPKEAAEAFLRAHALAPKSPLAPDALARAVEALNRAGENDAARRTAQKFVNDFPQSGRIDAVRRWGALP